MSDVIQTEKAPQAIGTYSQAVRVGDTVYLSGQIGLDPESMDLVEGGVKAQAQQAFANLRAVTQAAGGDLDKIVKLTILLADMADFAVINEVMAECFSEPYPARAAFAVKTLPKNALMEVEGVMTL